MDKQFDDLDKERMEAPEISETAELSDELLNMEELSLENDEPEESPDLQIKEVETDDFKDPSFKKDSRRRAEKSILQYVHDLVYLLAIIMIVFVLLFRVVVVSGTSMNRTLLDGDYLLVLSNTLYKNPKFGDVIVASKKSFDNGAPIVKRVIATEGQTVDIDFTLGIVYVNGTALDEPYTFTPTTVKEGVEFPLVVEEGCVFVLGDNRNGSKDSRSPEIGLIDEREILGKVIFLFFPGDNGKTVTGTPKEDRDFGRIGVVD